LENRYARPLEDVSHRVQPGSRVLICALLLAAAGCGGRATIADDVAKEGAAQEPVAETEEEAAAADKWDPFTEAESEEERQFLRDLVEFQESVGGDYRIGLGDRLSIVFYGDPSIDRTVRVRPDGKISFPRVGDIPAAGFTPVELSGVISELYAEYLKNPEATVLVDDTGKQMVYVLGEVFRPGQFDIDGRMTLSQAMAEAGGWTPTGQLGSVVVIRRGGTWQRPQSLRVDFGRMLDGRLNYDVELRPFDIVYVPQTFIGDVADFGDTFFTKLITPPFTAILRVQDTFRGRGGIVTRTVP
jgi:protein involved in polysaccharide export with SLBB domain